MRTITTSISHSYNTGDTIIISIDNGFWKMFWHWLIQKPLKKFDTYEVGVVINDHVMTILNKD